MKRIGHANLAFRERLPLLLLLMIVLSGCAGNSLFKAIQTQEAAPKQGWLGLALQPVTPELAKALGLSKAQGAFVDYPAEGSPAEKAGLQRGDVIVAYQGKVIAEVDDLPPLVLATYPGTNVTLSFIRDGIRNTANATVGTLIKEPANKAPTTSKSEPAIYLQQDIAKAEEAASAGRMREALRLYTYALAISPPFSRHELKIQQAIIKLVQNLEPKPAIPQEAERHAFRAQARLEMAQSEAELVKVAKEYGKALRFAPWWTSGYYNLGLVLEQAELYGHSINYFNLFLLAEPNSPEARAVQSRIYRLEILKEEQNNIKKMAGKWPGGAEVYIKGNQIKILANKVTPRSSGKSVFAHQINGTIKGRTIEGTVRILKHAHLERHHTWRDNACIKEIKAETTEVIKGVLDPENSIIEVTFLKPNYSWRHKETWDEIWCDELRLISRTQETIRLIR